MGLPPLSVHWKMPSRRLIQISWEEKIEEIKAKRDQKRFTVQTPSEEKMKAKQSE